MYHFRNLSTPQDITDSRHGWLRVIVALLTFSLTLTPAILAQTPSGGSGKKEMIAVLEMEMVGAAKAEASAITDRLREELLRSGKFSMVDRSQLENILNEQALQQAGCTSQECAVQVGRMLGVKKMVSGRVTKLSDTQWLVSAQMIDVETTETLRAESLRHRGDFFTLMDLTIVELASKISGVDLKNTAEAIAAQEKAEVGNGGGMPWWGWALIGVGVLGVAAALGGKKETPAQNNDPCASGCGSVNITW